MICNLDSCYNFAPMLHDNCTYPANQKPVIFSGILLQKNEN